MRRTLLYAGIVLACCTAAGAVMVELTTADLVDHAAVVVTGTVEGVKSLPPDGRGVIYTEAMVRVEDTVVGALDKDVVVVRYMGGQYGDLGMVVEDQPTFAPGEKVVLFLQPTAGGAYECPDACQSKQIILENTVMPAGKSLPSYLAEVTAAAGR